MIPEFKIISQDKISAEFKKRNIDSFSQAALFIANLPYGRNENKKELCSIFVEKRGTCSTKHAVLKTLALENEFNGLLLILGIVKADQKNTPAITGILKKYDLKYMPEAHNYFRFAGKIFDYTTSRFTLTSNPNDILHETEIEPEHITDFKMKYHKEFLGRWIKENDIQYSEEEIWEIREQCIEALAK